MATFEEHIESLTQIDIGTTTSPSTSDLTEILKDTVVITVNNITTLRPEEMFKFTTTTNSTSSVARLGKVLSVVREHDSTSILRPATAINPSLRTSAADKESLNFRSKYNPGFYELDGQIYVVPAAGGSDNDIVVTQMVYDTGITAGDNYLSGAVDNFPTDYEPLLGLYASAMVCNAKAIEINNNMPSAPTAPNMPDLSIEGVKIPELPVFDIESPTSSLSNALSTINNEDLENLSKNADRKTKVELDEYTKELELYGAEIQFFKNDLEESAVQYKWYSSQQVSFMNQYNSLLGIKLPKRKEEKPQKKGDE